MIYKDILGSDMVCREELSEVLEVRKDDEASAFQMAFKVHHPVKLEEQEVQTNEA